MGYKSLKRVIGETTLERKCRLLFGTCLTLFIFGAFYAVERIAEQLVMSATRNKGRNVVAMMLVRAHDRHLVTDYRDLTQALLSDIDRQNKQIKYDLLTIDHDVDMKWIEPRYLPLPGEPANVASTKSPSGTKTMRPADKAGKDQPLKARDTGELDKGEIEKLRSIVTDLKLRYEEAQRSDEPPKSDDEGIWAERAMARKDQYQYFEPVHLSESCAQCHLELTALGAADGGPIQGTKPPFIVMRVTLPYGETAAAINRTRAILITVAILTIFVAMIALYVIIRFLVVKPLKHLRDVSDDVSRGHTEVRAEIHTNDEFEELASSYNRMLRHLTDTQGALQDANSELDGKVDELAQLSMRLYEMNRLKNDFLANMSHELRTPLNSIIGFSEVLHGIESLSDKQKRYAGNIQKSGRVLLEMINDILDLAKMEAGKMDVRPSEFKLDVVINAQCDMVRALTEEKNIDLDVDVSPDLPAVYQDQAKLQQILTNLLSNAIKFTPEGGRITVSAERMDDKLELKVADTGVGIADEDREVIFEKFRQGAMALGQDSLTREYSGTGLGLSILKELSKLMDGEVTFESQLGIGSTFRVVLPWEHTAVSPVGTSVAHKLEELEQQQRINLERQSQTNSGDATHRKAV